MNDSPKFRCPECRKVEAVLAELVAESEKVLRSLYLTNKNQAIDIECLANAVAMAKELLR